MPKQHQLEFEKTKMVQHQAHENASSKYQILSQWRCAKKSGEDCIVPFHFQGCAFKFIQVVSHSMIRGKDALSDSITGISKIIFAYMIMITKKQKLSFILQNIELETLIKCNTLGNFKTIWPRKCTT